MCLILGTLFWIYIVQKSTLRSFVFCFPKSVVTQNRSSRLFVVQKNTNVFSQCTIELINLKYYSYIQLTVPKKTVFLSESFVHIYYDNDVSVILTFLGLAPHANPKWPSCYRFSDIHVLTVFHSRLGKSGLTKPMSLPCK